NHRALGFFLFLFKFLLPAHQNSLKSTQFCTPAVSKRSIICGTSSVQAFCVSLTEKG
ncbi:hypothetical protein KSS87_010237, partial [Heliosperma pusillum]